MAFQDNGDLIIASGTARRLPYSDGIVRGSAENDRLLASSDLTKSDCIHSVCMASE